MKIILVGAPGSGKGTISERLIENGYNHLSTGNIFRKLAKKENDDTADKLRTFMTSGKLIPDDFTNEVAKKEIMELINENKSFVLDGYPRTEMQANFLSTICKIDQVYFLDVDQSVLVKRITGRRSCDNCKKIYNVFFDQLKPKQEGICDVCGHLLSKRKDDNEETVKQRIESFEEDTMPLINYYQKLGILTKIDGNLTTDEQLEIILKGK